MSRRSNFGLVTSYNNVTLHINIAAKFSELLPLSLKYVFRTILDHHVISLQNSFIRNVSCLLLYVLVLISQSTLTEYSRNVFFFFATSMDGWVDQQHNLWHGAQKRQGWCDVMCVGGREVRRRRIELGIIGVV